MNLCVALFHPKYFPLLKHKYLEFDAGYFKPRSSYFDFIFRWTRNIHHAGPSLWIELFGIFLALDIYDNRHWNYEEEKWEDCDTEEEQ